MNTMQALTTLQLTDGERERMHALYRHLHAHPELSMQEHQTAELIAEKLDGLGIENFRCGGTGVVGVLRNGPGPVIGFRADTDGLPIAEETGLDYASTATGTLPDGTKVPLMHGCGHDVHVTCLLTAAKLLSEAREAWSGTLVLIFQPGRKPRRAPPWSRTGCGTRPRGRRSSSGSTSCRAGPEPSRSPSGSAMAMADSLKVTVFGRQSHGSMPQDAIDPWCWARTWWSACRPSFRGNCTR